MLRLLDRLFDHDRAGMLIVLAGLSLPLLFFGADAAEDVIFPEKQAECRSLHCPTPEEIVDSVPMPAFDIDQEVDRILRDLDQ